MDQMLVGEPQLSEHSFGRDCVAYIEGSGQDFDSAREGSHLALGKECCYEFGLCDIPESSSALLLHFWKLIEHQKSVSGRKKRILQSCTDGRIPTFLELRYPGDPRFEFYFSLEYDTVLP